MSVTVWDVAEPIQVLIASGSAVDERRLADPYVPLTEPIAGEPAALEEVAP